MYSNSHSNRAVNVSLKLLIADVTKLHPPVCSCKHLFKKKSKKSFTTIIFKNLRRKTTYVMIFIFSDVSNFSQYKSYIWLQLLFIEQFKPIIQLVVKFLDEANLSNQKLFFYTHHCTKSSFKFMFVPSSHSIIAWLSFENASTNSLCEILSLTGKLITFCFVLTTLCKKINVNTGSFSFSLG